MGKPRGFLEIRRSKNATRPIAERVNDFAEYELPMAEEKLRDQAARCMDCGVPFCHDGCPLGNLVPEWNDLVMAGRWAEASASLHATNNFPEVTGRVCPAPCEASCVLAMPSPHGEAHSTEPVTIKSVERAIADWTFDQAAALQPHRARARTGKKIAVVGSGPAGLACAQQLARGGHEVVVFERADRVGGLLRYGIPDFKLSKKLIDLRVEQLRAEGVVFRTGVEVGVTLRGEEVQREFDAVALCGGATRPRDLRVPGRELEGVHFAMTFLEQQNRRVAGDVVREPIVATNKHVVVLGGGDTGSDCVGTSHRQGAKSVTSLELMPRPPDERRADNPWPQWPLVFRTSSSHEEGGAREFGVMTKRLVGDGQGNLRALHAVRVETREGKLVEIAGTDVELPCDLLLLAMGFVGPVHEGLLQQLGVALDARGNVAVSRDRGSYGKTSVSGVFAAGDMARGQSLVVWAISEGRKCAETIDAHLRAAARDVAE